MKAKIIGILAIALMLMAMGAGTAVAPDTSIDIKPGSFPNSINLRSNGVIPVAILGTYHFDANLVDPTSLKFGPNEATPFKDKVSLEDVNGDGWMDLVAHFKVQETGISPGDTQAALKFVYNGTDYTRYDSVRTVPTL